MPKKDTESKTIRHLVPPWAWPGLIPLIAESKLPTEKGYTTSCARRYEGGAAWEPSDRMEELEAHLTSGGNIGWVPPEGICVVDCDNAQAVSFVDPRRDSKTPIMSRRPGVKEHFYFSYDPATFNAYSRAGIKIEIGSDQAAQIDIKSCGFSDPKRAGGGYVVMPPSHHEDGLDYKWARKLPKSPELIPEMSLDLRNAFSPFLTRGRKRDGAANRHSKLLKYQQRLVIEAGCDDEETREEIVERCAELAGELFADDPGRLADELASIDREYDGAKAHGSAFQGHSKDGSDADLAARVSGALEGGLWYARETRDWRTWEDGYWKVHHPLQVRRDICNYHRELMHEAAEEQDDEKQKKTIKHMMKLKSASGVENVYRIMQPQLAISISEFDKERDLVTAPGDNDLGVGPVTINLRTGEMYEPRREDMISRVLGAPLVEGAQHPMVDRFLEESFPDPDTRACVLMHLGVSMLGHMPTERFYFLHGKGASGKGTLAGAMIAALGGYATVADPSSISGQGGIDGSRNSPDLRALMGTRFVFVDEIAASRTLGSRLKNLTQDGTVTAAGKYEAQMTFPITWTTWIAGNARPRIDATDKGLLRRIVEVPMDKGAVDNDHIDWHVKDTLKTDPLAVAAFLWKLVEGLGEARQYEFMPPLSAEMQDATDDWIEMSDMVGPWLSECVELTHNIDNKEMSSTLFTHYEEWMDDTYGRLSRRDVLRATPNQFAESLKSRGLTKRRTNRGVYWIGLKIVRPSDELAEGAAPEDEGGKLPN